MAQAGPGELRVKVDYISLDPAMRGWMNDAKSYVAPVGLGDVMRAYAAGIVEASNNPDFKPGDAVQGLFGVQRYFPYVFIAVGVALGVFALIDG